MLREPLPQPTQFLFMQEMSGSLRDAVLNLKKVENDSETCLHADILSNRELLLVDTGPELDDSARESESRQHRPAGPLNYSLVTESDG